MANKLKKVKLNFISLVSKFARPVVDKAEIAFVKSDNKEGIEVDNTFLKSISDSLNKLANIGKKPEVTEDLKKAEDTPAVVPETEESAPAVEDAPVTDFVTKSEFSDLAKQVSAVNSNLSQVGELIKGLVEASVEHQQTIDTKLNTELARVKREQSPMQQRDMASIVKSQVNNQQSSQKTVTGGYEGAFLKNWIGENKEEVKFVSNRPRNKSSYSRALDAFFGLDEN